MSHDTEFGRWLRKKLVERHLSLAQLCRTVGCDYTYLWRIIHADTARGRKYTRPSYLLTRKVGEALSAPREALVAAGYEEVGSLEDARVSDRIAQIEQDLTQLRSTLGPREIQDPASWRMHRIPLVGNISAGELREALENPEGHLDLPSLMAREGDYALRVRGSSMAPTLLEGDLVVVRQSSPEPGQIVAARIGDDDEVTLKRYSIVEGLPTLVPDNPEYKSVPCGPKVTILGVVTGSFRPPEVLLRRPD
jgi:SOS-response transcriptional repressor LexA